MTAESAMDSVATKASRIDSPMVTTKARRTRLAHGEPAAKLEATGFNTILGMVESGMTMNEIAKRCGVPRPTLSAWISADSVRADLYARVIPLSAEACADRGLEALESADPTSNSDVNLRRAIEQHWRWRAAVRNPRYSDKQSVELSGPNGGPIAQSVVHVFVPANNRDTVVNTIDGETLDKDDA